MRILSLQREAINLWYYLNNLGHFTAISCIGFVLQDDALFNVPQNLPNVMTANVHKQTTAADWVNRYVLS